MRHLGFFFRDGPEGAQDYAQAVHWFTKAAEGGDSGGMECLGWMYERGLGVPKDSETALLWYAKAAAAGNQEAIQRLKGVK